MSRRIYSRNDAWGFTGASHSGPPDVVALGGGHGLAASLRALRRISDRVTAIVGVADDGGSSGRLRAEFDVLPPGDLRMALAALCGDDTWGQTWERVIQHRFPGDGPLGGHTVGNLLITALWQNSPNTVEGLEWMAALLEAQGRVLPCAFDPLTIVADIRGHDPKKPEQLSTVRGQVEVATTAGVVESLGIEPAQPRECPEAIEAVTTADAVILGPGSWFTSVMPHLVLPGLGDAIRTTSAMRVLVLNLNPQLGETTGFSPHHHIDVLGEQFPWLAVDVIIADPVHVHDHSATEASARALGASVMWAPVAAAGRPGIHDARRLAVAFDTVLRDHESREGREPPWQ